MGRDSSLMGDEFELSLELSIGGCYAKPKSENKNLQRENDDESNLDISRSDLISINDVGCELSDPMRKREIRALKRKEARMKREVKQSRGLNSVEERDGNGIPEESPAKREKIDAENSNMSRLMQAQFPMPIGSGFAYPWKSSVDEPEQPSSSVVSHHRSTCTSHRGGSSSDSGSHSNSFGTHQNQQGSKIEYVEVNNSSSQSNTTKVVQGSMVKKRVHSNLTDNTCSSTQKPSLPPTSSIAKLPNPSQIDASTTRMPRVTTTGNGPNGKTIQGLLYKYAESEVSIMCVCHGRFFSPAEFVEHAGGIDVTHPLRHITVDPGTVKR